jgi:hypothetical protein
MGLLRKSFGGSNKGFRDYTQLEAAELWAAFPSITPKEVGGNC